MKKLLLLSLGFGFIGVGLFGFACTSFLGSFAVAPEHNIVHIASGLIALVVVFIGDQAMRFYARSFGFLYLVMAVWGFFSPMNQLCSIFISNSYGPDSLLHIVIAALLLAIGFFREPLMTKKTLQSRRS